MQQSKFFYQPYFLKMYNLLNRIENLYEIAQWKSGTPSKNEFLITNF